MAKPYRLSDFKKIYPEANEEVIAVLKITERKMQYQEFDLKAEQIIIDEEKQTVTQVQFQVCPFRHHDMCGVRAALPETGMVKVWAEEGSMAV